MNKARDWCRKNCKRCTKPRMPNDGNSYNVRRIKNKSCSHWTVVGLGMCVMAALLITEFKRTDENAFEYFPPNLKMLKRKDPAIKISGIDFHSDQMRDKLQNLGDRMKAICDERSEDVVFAFQFGTKKRREDHIFALCKDYNTMVLGNGEVVGKSDEYVMCTEEYDGELRYVKRPSSILLKGIDVSQWEPIEYESSSIKESCILQHAIDILESKWI